MKIQVSLKSDKNNGYLETNIHFWSYLAHFLLEWEMFQTKVVEKIKVTPPPRTIVSFMR